MVLLVHHSISPQSRKVRLIMAEKKMLFVLKEEEPWNISPDIRKINPSGDLPVLIFDGNVVSGNYAITEYLEESNPQYKLMPTDVKERAEVRRLMDWFDTKFYNEVYKYVVAEKIIKRFQFKLAPNSKVLKVGLNNLRFHMEYIDYLADKNNYIAGKNLSLADLTIAAHLSILDYLFIVINLKSFLKSLNSHSILITSFLEFNNYSGFSRNRTYELINHKLKPYLNKKTVITSIKDELLLNPRYHLFSII